MKKKIQKSGQWLVGMDRKYKAWLVGLTKRRGDELALTLLTLMGGLMGAMIVYPYWGFLGSWVVAAVFFTAVDLYAHGDLPWQEKENDEAKAKDVNNGH